MSLLQAVCNRVLKKLALAPCAIFKELITQLFFELLEVPVLKVIIYHTALGVQFSFLLLLDVSLA